MSGSDTTLNIATDATATFAAYDELVEKQDDGEESPISEIAEKANAAWGNFVDDCLIQTNEVFKGSRTCTALSAHSVVMGDASDSPTARYAKSAAGTATCTFSTHASSDQDGDKRFLFDASEQFAFQSRAAGSWADVMRYDGTTWAVTPAATFAGALTVTTGAITASAGGITVATAIVSSGASGQIRTGDGTGAPLYLIYKGAGSHGIFGECRSGGTSTSERRWQPRYTATTEDYEVRRYNGSGVFQDNPFVLNFSTGAATLLATTCSSLTSSGAIQGTVITATSEIRFGSTSGPLDDAGTGTPEGAVTAPIGSTWRRTDGGAGTTLYIKESGAGNTGWSPASRRRVTLTLMQIVNTSSERWLCLGNSNTSVQSSETASIVTGFVAPFAGSSVVIRVANGSNQGTVSCTMRLYADHSQISSDTQNVSSVANNAAINASNTATFTLVGSWAAGAYLTISVLGMVSFGNTIFTITFEE